MFVTAALLVPAMMSTGAPGPAPAAEPALRSMMVPEAAADDPVDELAPSPGACPVFCSSDAYCNAHCATDSLCSNHRCVQF